MLGVYLLLARTSLDEEFLDQLAVFPKRLEGKRSKAFEKCVACI